MSIEVRMPHMGESVVEGKVLRWVKREGEAVHRHETLAEVETDKANVEIPAPQDGVLARILVGEGGTVSVGAPLAVLESRAEAPATAEAAATPPAPGAATAPAVEEGARPAPPPRPPAGAPREAAPGPARRLRITPVVAKIMERHGLGPEDLRAIRGTGAGGRVTTQDILAYVESSRGRRDEAGPPPAEGAAVAPGARARPAPAAPTEAEEEEPVEEVPLRGLRRAIAEHMVRSVREAPHVTTVAEVDMTTLVELRERHKARFQEEEEVPLTYMPFIVRAVCQGLKAFPYLNASLEGERILLRRYYHIGIAVAAEAGLVVPVIRHADRLSMRELAVGVHRAAEGARAQRLPAAALEGGTFTVTNPGVFGGLLSTPIIHQPQAAILGVQAIRKTPVAHGDRIAIRSMMYLCLSYDHRIVDGAVAVQFLQEVRCHLEDPLGMLI